MSNAAEDARIEAEVSAAAARRVEVARPEYREIVRELQREIRQFQQVDLDEYLLGRIAGLRDAVRLIVRAGK